MAKYSLKEITEYKRFITIADMEKIAPKYNLSWETLRRVLIGEAHYDKGSEQRKAMIAEAIELIRNRATKALEVIGAEVVTERDV